MERTIIAARVTDSAGKRIDVGDTVMDHRMEPWTFAGVARMPEAGRSGKVYVRVISTDESNGEYGLGWFNQSVFRLTIEPIEQVESCTCHNAPVWPCPVHDESR